MDNPYWKYKFAKNIKGANCALLSELTIDSGDGMYNYLFARDIPGVDVRKHGEVVINSGDALLNYVFMRDVPNADVDRHLEVIKTSKFSDIIGDSELPALEFPHDENCQEDISKQDLSDSIFKRLVLIKKQKIIKKPKIN